MTQDLTCAIMNVNAKHDRSKDETVAPTCFYVGRGLNVRQRDFANGTDISAVNFTFRIFHFVELFSFCGTFSRLNWKRHKRTEFWRKFEELHLEPKAAAPLTSVQENPKGKSIMLKPLQHKKSPPKAKYLEGSKKPDVVIIQANGLLKLYAR